MIAGLFSSLISTAGNRQQNDNLNLSSREVCMHENRVGTQKGLCQSLPRESPDFVHRFAHNGFRHIVHYLDSANFAGQNKMHHTIACLLVCPESAHHTSTAHRKLRQRSEVQYSIPDALGSMRICLLSPHRDVSCSDHSPSHSLTVQQAPIPSLGLERVTNRVAKIQHSA